MNIYQHPTRSLHTLTNSTDMPENLNILLQEIQAETIQEHRAQNVELKESWDKKHGKDLSALANKLGATACWLIVGVKDNGKLVGQDEKWAKRQEEIISQQINEYLDPVQACTGLTCHNINGNWIVIAEIRNPGDVTYWGNSAYVASGTTSRVLEANEVLELRLKLPGLTDYSQQPTVSKYDDDLLSCFMDRIVEKGQAIDVGSDPLDTLHKLNIYILQVARILFGDCTYRIVKYDRFGDPVSNVRRTGLYYLLTDDFHNDVQTWASTETDRQDSPYPPKALQEALANAVAHAAYFENDGDVIVELYHDKLSVSNLCVRESVYFANRWFSRSHKTVNSLLMEVLRIARHVDELGRGKNLIFSASIRNGKMPPEVVVEKAGRYDRWKLTIHGNTKDDRMLRLLDRIRNIYNNDQRSLIAFALVLWSDKSIQEIRRHVDGDFERQFNSVLDNFKGPFYYYHPEDKIILKRWVNILLGEGQDSKEFSQVEENRLKVLAYEVSSMYLAKIITPRDLREMAQMGDTRSEQTHSSRILSKWCKDGLLKRISKGKYKFVRKPDVEGAHFEAMIKAMQKLNQKEQLQE